MSMERTSGGNHIVSGISESFSFFEIIILGGAVIRERVGWGR